MLHKNIKQFEPIAQLINEDWMVKTQNIYYPCLTNKPNKFINLIKGIKGWMNSFEKYA